MLKTKSLFSAVHYKENMSFSSPTKQCGTKDDKCKLIPTASRHVRLGLNKARRGAPTRAAHNGASRKELISHSDGIKLGGGSSPGGKSDKGFWSQVRMLGMLYSVGHNAIILPYVFYYLDLTLYI